MEECLKENELQNALAICLEEVIRLKTELETQKKQIEALMKTQQKLFSISMDTGYMENLRYEWNGAGQFLLSEIL